jgi:hypothetical protein
MKLFYFTTVALSLAKNHRCSGCLGTFLDVLDLIDVLTPDSDEDQTIPASNAKCNECYFKLQRGMANYFNTVGRMDEALTEVVMSGSAVNKIQTEYQSQRDWYNNRLKKNAQVFEHCNDECIVGYKGMHKVIPVDPRAISLNLYFRSLAVNMVYIHFSKLPRPLWNAKSTGNLATVQTVGKDAEKKADRVPMNVEKTDIVVVGTLI